MFGFFKNKKQEPQGQAEDSMLYCPSCGDEYRAGFDRCSTCDVELIRGATGAGEAGNGIRQVRKMVQISSGDELVPIKRSGMIEIKSLQRLLAANGIDSLMAGADADCSKGCCRSAAFDLNVRREDYASAAEVVEQEFCRSTGLDALTISEQPEAVYDERLVRTRCPGCGSEFASSERTCPDCGLCF